MQTLIIGRDIAMQDYLANQIRGEMQAGKAGIVVAADSHLIESAVHSWKDVHHAHGWEQFHWIQLGYSASFSFPMNLTQTPKALLDTWSALHLPGYVEFQEAVFWYAHREETATIFELNDYFLLQRFKETRGVNLGELIIEEAISLFSPLKPQVGQRENRINMRHWLEDGHWIFFDVSQLEQTLRNFIAEYMSILYENEQNDQSVFITNGIPPFPRIQRFENLISIFSHMDDWENWIRENQERRFVLFSTTAEEAKRLNDLGIASINTDASSLKPREFISVCQAGEQRSFVPQRENPPVSASLKHQIQEKDGFPRERVLSLLREQEEVGR